MRPAHAPMAGYIEAVRLANVSLDELGAIGQQFVGFHYNVVV